jgi:hypothetical protein
MMKVPPHLRTVYEQQHQLNETLRATAQDVMAGFKQPRWHYEARLKRLESFALKIESGRVPDPSAMEDFFACTLVVRNSGEVPVAEAEVLEHFRLVERRPRNPIRTHKGPEAFPFDDLRLYVTLKPSELSRPTDLENITFEIQIKSFLQHAWSIATHDLLYKSNDVRWAKARIAYQIKAMLEHAELVIEEVEPLAGAQALAKTDVRTEEVSLLIEAIKERWPNERLPTDVKRLAENILTALRCFSAIPSEFGQLIDAESEQGRGVRSLNLSPYSATIQALVMQKADRLNAFLKKSDRSRLAVPAEIDVPDGLTWPPVSERVIMI